MDRRPLVAPVFPAGAEPLPPGWTEEDRNAMTQQKRMENYMGMAMESCVVKTAMSGALGTSSYLLIPRKRLVIRPHISLYLNCIRFWHGRIFFPHVHDFCLRGSIVQNMADGYHEHVTEDCTNL
jgi:hypothetical protein